MHPWYLIVLRTLAVICITVAIMVGLDLASGIEIPGPAIVAIILIGAAYFARRKHRGSNDPAIPNAFSETFRTYLKKRFSRN